MSGFVANAQAKAGSCVKATPLRVTASEVGVSEVFQQEIGFIRDVAVDREAMRAYYAQWVKERTSGNVWNYLCCLCPCVWTTALCGCGGEGPCCCGECCLSTGVQPFSYEKFIGPALPWNRRYENIERVINAKGHVALTDHGIVYKELAYTTILYSCCCEVPDVNGARAIPPTSKTIPYDRIQDVKITMARGSSHPVWDSTDPCHARHCADKFIPAVIHSVEIDTAGPGIELTIHGIKDPQRFRNDVLSLKHSGVLADGTRSGIGLQPSEFGGDGVSGLSRVAPMRAPGAAPRSIEMAYTNSAAAHRDGAPGEMAGLLAEMRAHRGILESIDTSLVAIVAQGGTRAYAKV